MSRVTPWLVVGLCVAACGGSSSTTYSDMQMSGGMIPAAGSGDKVDQDFTNVEPNDTPSTATPLGTAAAGDIRVWVTMDTIGGTDTSDYFVFNSAGTAGSFTFDICGGTGITMMTGTLWKVQNGTQVMPPIHMWTATGMSTGTCIMTASATDAPLEPNTEYLFGITATGTGTYSA